MAIQDSITAWDDSAQRVVALLRALPADAWTQPTDCPNWNVRDIAAHLAAVEAELAGVEEPLEIPTDSAGAALTTAYTQRGVDVRADVRPAALIDELERAVALRRAQLRDLDIEPDATPDRTPGDVDWPWSTLLSNRAVDMWVHEQDIREAVERPGGMDAAGASHTVAVFRSALPYVLGKRVAPPANTIVGWQITGPNAFDTTVAVGDDGRAHITDSTAADTTLTMTDRALTRRMAGRRAAAALEIGIDGDRGLGERVAEQMAIVA